MTERNDDITFSGSAARTGDDPTAIRAEIEDTRERLGDTLEQIGDRLNPRNLAAQVKGKVSEATLGKAQDAARTAADRVGEASEPLFERARQNPLPAVALAAGLGWLLAGAGRGRPSVAEGMSSGKKGKKAKSREAGYDTHPNPLAARPSYPPPRPAPSGARSTGSASALYGTESRTGESDMASAMGSASSVGSESASTSVGSIDDWSPTGSGLAGGLAGGAAGGSLGHTMAAGAAPGPEDQTESATRGAKVKEAASRLAGGARSAVGGAGARVKGAGGAVAEQTRERARRLGDSLQESPLRMGVATLAAGLAAGYAIPATDREVELMGDKRDELMDRVRGAVQQTRTQVKQTAVDAVEQTKTAAKQALHGQ